ncbi:RNA-binding cell elongation regulator Jag/EloR [Mangrovibacillus cuniculi]|uniref:RNA-binding protein KhpB n=1 Tax=Mangrovibacillus cuniculi TaxID=2593652 RepID=A0A7S8HGE9_9BACI|nr:RNA-binding cell elongation regulator Jag/EloR [Mangrovibacillus cuniculi]QPC47929.1 protein jag [Mangrovibacillus cuniculi]
MTEVTFSASTVEAAVKEACLSLGITENEAKVTILQEPKKKFLGLFGGQPAIVSVLPKPNAIKVAKAYLETILEKMGVAATVLVTTKGREATFEIVGDQLGVLIGKRGQTLNALNLLTQLVATHVPEHFVNITVDAGDYRNKRASSLQELAQRVADQVQQTGHSVKLEAMLPGERKTVHAALAKIKGVKTQSAGEDPNRYVIIKPNISNK